MKPNGDNLRLLYETLRTGMFQMRFNSEVKKQVEILYAKCGIAKWRYYQPAVNICYTKYRKRIFENGSSPEFLCRKHYLKFERILISKYNAVLNSDS